MDSPPALDLLFGALADPTRRAILEHLRDHGPCTAGELVQRFAHLSQPAVSKHLRLLRESGLVTDQREGRSVTYSLPEDGSLVAADAWLQPFRRAWVAKLQDLKRFVETGDQTATVEVPMVRLPVRDDLELPPEGSV